LHPALGYRPSGLENVIARSGLDAIARCGLKAIA
jgi:hypothetical protein